MLFRTIIVWGVGLPVTLVLFMVVLISFIFDRSGHTVHSISALWSRMVLLLAGVNVDVRGLENLPSGGPVILASNHQGIFDIPALLGYLPLQFRWVAKQSLFKIPIIGWTMRLAGYIGIDREHAGKAYRSIEEAAERIKQGTSVLIFPEGTRNPGDRLLPFKRGGFWLAARSEVPIVPIAIKGTRDIMKKGTLLIQPSSVKVSIGSPIQTRGVEDRELRVRTKEAIERELKRIGDEG